MVAKLRLLAGDATRQETGVSKRDGNIYYECGLAWVLPGVLFNVSYCWVDSNLRKVYHSLSLIVDLGSDVVIRLPSTSASFLSRGRPCDTDKIQDLLRYNLLACHSDILQLRCTTLPHPNNLGLVTVMGKTQSNLHTPSQISHA